jgi:hypothetical protein
MATFLTHYFMLVISSKEFIFAIVAFFMITIGFFIVKYNIKISQNKKRKREENNIQIQSTEEIKNINNQKKQDIVSKLFKEISNNVLINLLTSNKVQNFAMTQSLTAIDAIIYQSLLNAITRFEYYNDAINNNEQLNIVKEQTLQSINEELCVLINNLSEYDNTKTLEQQYEIIRHFLKNIYTYNKNSNMPQTKIETLLTPVIHKLITSTNVQSEKTDEKLKHATKQKLPWYISLIIFVLIFLFVRMSMNSYYIFTELFVIIVSMVFAGIATVIIVTCLNSIKRWFE